MKKIIIAVSIILTSCNSYKDYANQEITFLKKTSQSFTLEDNKLIIIATINENKGLFLFDTGAMSSVIQDSLFLSKIKTDKNSLKKGIKLVGASGVEIQSYNFISNLANCNLFSSKNKIFKLIKINKINQSCNKNIQNEDGIIGFDFMKESHNSILLDFEKNNIEILDESFSLNDYTKSSVKIKKLGNKIILPIFINGKKVDFLFDTGNSGGFKIREKDFITDTKPNLSINTLYGLANGITELKMDTYFNNSILFENERISSKLMVNNKTTVNTLGIDFIKNYNWILDFKNSSVYYKRIKNQEKEEFKIPKYNIQSISINNKLFVGLKTNFYNGNLNIKDQIISVNNEIITPENICEMENFLNSTTNWDELKIEIKKQ